MIPKSQMYLGARIVENDPDKIMTCFPWTIDLEEKQKMEQKMKNKKVPDPSKRHRLS